MKLIFPIWFMIKSIIPKILDFWLRHDDERMTRRAIKMYWESKQQSNGN